MVSKQKKLHKSFINKTNASIFILLIILIIFLTFGYLKSQQNSIIGSDVPGVPKITQSNSLMTPSPSPTVEPIPTLALSAACPQEGKAENAAISYDPRTGNIHVLEAEAAKKWENDAYYAAYTYNTGILVGLDAFGSRVFISRKCSDRYLVYTFGGGGSGSIIPKIIYSNILASQYPYAKISPELPLSNEYGISYKNLPSFVKLNTTPNALIRNIYVQHNPYNGSAPNIQIGNSQFHAEGYSVGISNTSSRGIIYEVTFTNFSNDNKPVAYVVISSSGQILSLNTY